MALLYMGFTQKAGIRSFQFEHTMEISARKTTRVALVLKADLSELMSAHVAVQDGPALCLHVLGSLLANNGSPVPLVHKITTDEVAAFMRLRRARSEPAPNRRRRRPKPSSASQLQWPRRA